MNAPWRVGIDPRWSLLAIVACAHLAGAPRGQKGLAAFAGRLSQGQRRALGIRKNPRSHTTTDFAARMSADHARRPHLKSLS